MGFVYMFVCCCITRVYHNYKYIQYTHQYVQIKNVLKEHFEEIINEIYAPKLNSKSSKSTPRFKLPPNDEIPESAVATKLRDSLNSLMLSEDGIRKDDQESINGNSQKKVDIISENICGKII